MSGATDHTQPAESDECRCKPGVESEGWQERRCSACDKAELNAWREVLARYHGNVGVIVLPPGPTPTDDNEGGVR